ncbi:DnaD domain protein [Anaeromicropila herbilytica]|uniref:DNA replication protein DnaD n=1 Tax=Anaeromicropila herbilytica TaxID=2785025 RepID=A0A7R7EHP7_9FIRM|nr:DnaD domain protein [Anaeromicropila herbilytica]BCN28962.1 DNA replication protein DnaD [Anaeromicropila herbilytica]
MSKITLYTKQSNDITVVSNKFIDYFMPRANGSFVKVYLYLLRCLTNIDTELSISMIADHLEDTEKDIMRALKYWNELSLIDLTCNSTGEITNIVLNDINALDSVKTSPNTEYAASSTELKSFSTPTPTSYEPQLKENSKVLDKPTYTDAQIEALTNTDEIKWLLNIIEIYLERLLKPTDIQLILYLYESLGFSRELILYLYEYCVSKNKKNASYIEAVALSWAEEGIDTVEKAENSTVMYNNNYNSVNKAFGLNRAPGAVEKQYINKWISTYSLSIEIIVEACNRTILRTGKPDFNYADKILENWAKKGVKQINDIKKLDDEHNKTNTKTKEQFSSNQTNQTKPIKNTSNRFNAFPQRNYSKEDYSSMEEKLLNKYLGSSKSETN